MSALNAVEAVEAAVQILELYPSYDARKEGAFSMKLEKLNQMLNQVLKRRQRIFKARRDIFVLWQIPSKFALK